MNPTRVVLIAAATFIAGGVITYLFLPEKIETRVEIKERKVIETVEVEVEKEVEVIKEVEKEVIVSEKKTKRTITKPDGTKITEEIYETNEQQIDRIRQAEKAKYKELVESTRKELEQEYSRRRVVTNPKRIRVYGGYDIAADSIGVGASYNLWGPITVGGFVINNTVMPTVGIKF